RVEAPVQVVVREQRGQQHPHAPLVQRVQQRTGAGLAPHRDVRGHRARLRQFGQGERLLGQRGRRNPHVIRGQGAPHLGDAPPQRALVSLVRALVLSQDCPCTVSICSYEREVTGATDSL